MPTQGASVTLSAQATMTCSVLQRITITPGNVHPGTGVHGPLTTDSYVQVTGLADGIYDT